MLLLLIFTIALALLFDFLNGMNDAANSIATVVSTRVLSPRKAVLWAAFFNFAAVFLFSVAVATTIGTGVVDSKEVTVPLILAALVGSVLWTYSCTQLGLPISVSHALVGGLAGAALAKSGVQALILPGIIKIVLFIFIAPLVGMVLGYFTMVIVFWACRNMLPKTVDRWFRRLQLVSAALYSLGHGTNDAQKTMGIISALLYCSGYLGDTFHIPLWVIISCYTAIALGTLTGGWKVIQTLGMKMTKLKPVHGFSAESAAACSILLSSAGGIPVSTTHTITGAIIGVGATTKFGALRWGVAYKILWAWILTIPCTAMISALVWELIRLVGL